MRIVRPIRIRSGRFDGAEDFSRTVQLHVMGVRYAAVDLFSDADGCGQAQFRAAYGHVGIRAAVLGHQRTGRFGEDPVEAGIRVFDTDDPALDLDGGRRVGVQSHHGARRLSEPDEVGYAAVQRGDVDVAATEEDVAQAQG